MTEAAPLASLDPETLRSLHLLARATVERAARGEAVGLDESERAALPVAATRAGSVFVTIKIREHDGERWRLRGCIGSIEAVSPLADAVVDAARGAALEDPRFPALTADELPRIRISTTVLGPPRPIAVATEIETTRHGVILERDGRRALFLPQVARDTGWGRVELLENLARKAGLPPDAWRGATLSVFDAESVGDDES